MGIIWMLCNEVSKRFKRTRAVHIYALFYESTSDSNGQVFYIFQKKNILTLVQKRIHL